MKDYLNYINDHYPIRKTEKEKELFRNYILDELKDSRYLTKVEKLDKHNNIIAGDLKRAQVIFTAHYDTPATSIIPNLIIPRNKFLWFISHYTLPIILSILSFITASFLSESLNGTISQKIFLGIFFYCVSFAGFFYLCMFLRKNKHNKNDNTSGVATLMSFIHECYSEEAAFVLLDNEEKGLLGSKALNKQYSELLEDKLVINFDCVGLGNHILFIAKEKAMNHVLYKKVQKYNQSNERYNVLYFPLESSKSSSDYKSFECGIGVVACKFKNNIYYTNKIHTNRDNEAYPENIEFLVNNMIKFIDHIES